MCALDEKFRVVCKMRDFYIYIFLEFLVFSCEHTRVHLHNLIPSSVNFPTECHGWMLVTDGWFLVFLVGLFEDAVDIAFKNLYEIAAKHTWTGKAEAPDAIRYAGNGLQFSEWRITSGEKRGMLASYPDIFFISNTDGLFSRERNIGRPKANIISCNAFVPDV